MKKAQTIYQNGDHRWIAIARDPERPDSLIDTNEYLVADGDQGMLCDPGGLEIFPAVFSALSEVYDPAHIGHLFASHQDPDVISALGLWVEFNPGIHCYISWLWAGFVPHFGGGAQTFIKLPDEGGQISLGRLRMEVVPAHYLHSAGNFHLYDPLAKLLFSGDIGAALLPPGEEQLFVTDFDRHIPHAAGFHRRWMGSNEAKRSWCERVARLDIDMLCPQHGAIYRGQDVERFINWLDELRVGIV